MFLLLSSSRSYRLAHSHPIPEICNLAQWEITLMDVLGMVGRDMRMETNSGKLNENQPTSLPPSATRMDGMNDRERERRPEEELHLL